LCSLHFKNEDFKENSKTRVLRAGAVPTIFPGYPKYKQISKSERAPPKARNEIPTKRRKLQEDESITDCFNESQRSSVSESSPPLPSTEFTFVCCRERDTGTKWHRECVNMKARYKRLLQSHWKLQGLTMIAGFCIRSLKEKISVLIKYMVNGIGRRRRQRQIHRVARTEEDFSAFVKKVFSCLEVLREQTLRKRNVVKIWLDILKPNLPDFMVCGCKDSSHSAKIQEI